MQTTSKRTLQRQNLKETKRLLLTSLLNQLEDSIAEGRNNTFKQLDLLDQIRKLTIGETK